MNGAWASLGGYGNVDARAPLPIGRTNNAGVLGMLAQVLMQQGAKAQPQVDDDEELSRLLAQAFGMIPQSPTQNPGIRGY